MDRAEATERAAFRVEKLRADIRRAPESENAKRWATEADLLEALIAVTPTPPEPPADLVKRLVGIYIAAENMTPRHEGSVTDGIRAVLSALASGDVGEWLPSEREMARIFDDGGTRAWGGGWTDLRAGLIAHLAPRLTALRAELAEARAGLVDVQNDRANWKRACADAQRELGAALEEAERLRRLVSADIGKVTAAEIVKMRARIDALEQAASAVVAAHHIPEPSALATLRDVLDPVIAALRRAPHNPMNDEERCLVEERERNAQHGGFVSGETVLLAILERAKEENDRLKAAIRSIRDCPSREGREILAGEVLS